MLTSFEILNSLLDIFVRLPADGLEKLDRRLNAPDLLVRPKRNALELEAAPARLIFLRRVMCCDWVVPKPEGARANVSVRATMLADANAISFWMSREHLSIMPIPHVKHRQRTPRFDTNLIPDPKNSTNRLLFRRRIFDATGCGVRK
jgi:hypothetical protein